MHFATVVVLGTSMASFHKDCKFNQLRINTYTNSELVVGLCWYIKKNQETEKIIGASVWSELFLMNIWNEV